MELSFFGGEKKVGGWIKSKFFFIQKKIEGKTKPKIIFLNPYLSKFEFE